MPNAPFGDQCSEFPMKYIFASIALCFFAMAPSRVFAGVVHVDISFQLSLTGGSDTLGLDGANVNFKASFANGTTYSGVDPFPSAVTSAHSVKISGATNVMSNNTFMDPDTPLTYDPNGFDALFLDAGLFFPRTPVIDAGLSFVFGIDLAGPGAVPSVGDFVDASDFASTPSGFSDLSAVTFDGQFPAVATYMIAAPGGNSSFTLTATGSTDPNSGGGGVVPEPTSFAIFAMGTLLMGCGIRRRQS
jgi:hypothetical protein